MNTREVLNDIQNYKVFESLVETMRTIGSSLYPRLDKKLIPVNANLNSLKAGMNSVKEYLVDKEIQSDFVKKFFSGEEKGKVLIVVIGSNRAFCGDLNRKIVKSSNELIDEYINTSQDYSIISVGKKLANSFNQYSSKLIINEAFPEKSFKSNNYSELSDLLNKIIKEDFSKLTIVYTKIDKASGNIKTGVEVTDLAPYTDENGVPSLSKNDFLQRPFIIEPTPVEDTISNLIVQYLFIALHAFMLHSFTSENYQRMNAMNQASTSIKEVIMTSTRMLAKERKRVITKNLIEVISASIQEKELEKQIR